MAGKRREWTVVAMLEWATNYLEKNEVPNPRYSIEWLLADVLQMKRLDLYLYYDRPLSSQELDELRPLFKRRADHEPLQYITGYSEFINARLNVTPAVLIPRMETEQLVEYILDRHAPAPPRSVLDIGTGSGCIPIALKMERTDWPVTALDNSPDALTVARQNAQANQVDIEFKQFDILTDAPQTLNHSFDIIVSNPPYVLPKEADSLEPQVKEYEPAEALFCDDIEQMYNQIIALAYTQLSAKGSLYLEIHSGQKKKIFDLFDQEKWQVQSLPDYDTNDRFIHAQKRSK